MKLQAYINYYIGCPCIYYMADDDPDGYHIPLDYDIIKRWLADQDETDIKLVLRRLEDMDEPEMVGLLQSMAPPDMEDKPTPEDYDLEMFYNDDGLMVDGDIAVGANYSCRCYEGQIGIKICGSIVLFDETGKDVTRDELTNVPKAFHYLLRQGFDLFSLIDAGLAIDNKTLQP